MSWLNRIFDVFSRRDKSTSNNLTHDIPYTFRNRVFLWCKEVFSNSRTGFGSGDYTSEFWKEVHRFLQYRHGSIQISDLSRTPQSQVEDVISFLIECPGEEFLDFVEYIFKVDCLFHINIQEDQLVSELNDLLRIDNLPYYITDYSKTTVKEVIGTREANIIKTLAYPRVILRETELIHSQTIKPALELLQRPEFSNANSEFLEGLEDYRKGDFGDCLTKCASAFESVMKILCERKSWPYKQTDTASTLIKTILQNCQLENYFEPPLIIVATLRNKLSKSHGAGSIEKKIPKYLVRYSINATASAILLVVEAAGDH